MLPFRTFVEVQTSDGYGNLSWSEICLQPGFLDGYCAGFDGYISTEMYLGLRNIRDGYYSKMLSRIIPTDVSQTVRYKLDMLRSGFNIHVYYLYLDEISAFPLYREIYGSALTANTTFLEAAPDFFEFYVPSLIALGPPVNLDVRLLICQIF